MEKRYSVVLMISRRFVETSTIRFGNYDERDALRFRKKIMARLIVAKPELASRLTEVDASGGKGVPFWVQSIEEDLLLKSRTNEELDIAMKIEPYFPHEPTVDKLLTLLDSV